MTNETVKQQLLPKEVEHILPSLYAQDGKGLDATALIKFFTPDHNWTWYVTEYDPKEELFFGLVIGHEPELGYFTLGELASLRGPLGLPVERDLYFSPKSLKECT